MRVFLILFLMTLLSCQLHQDNKSKPEIDIQKKSEKTMPPFVQDYLNRNLQGWQLAESNDWQDTVFNQHITDTSNIGYILADINCDNKMDFTGILKDSTGQHAAFQIYSLDEYYISKQLETYGPKPLRIGLRLFNSKTPFKHYDGSLETFICGAIERFNSQNDEKKIFYQTNKGFFEITVGERYEKCNGIFYCLDFLSTRGLRK